MPPNLSVQLGRASSTDEDDFISSGHSCLGGFEGAQEKAKETKEPADAPPAIDSTSMNANEQHLSSSVPIGVIRGPRLLVVANGRAGSIRG